MYQSFYDKDGIVFYSKFNSEFAFGRAIQVRNFLIDNKCNVNSVLDLACGTGDFLNAIAQNLPTQLLVGLDLSQDMIDFAKQKNSNNISYYVDDMVSFSFDNKFDLVTCNYDAVNHLSSEQELLNMFKNVYKHLSPNGLFIFDFNTEKKLKYGNSCYYKSYDNLDLVNVVFIKGNKICFETFAYFKEEDKYIKKTFYLEETIFSNKVVKKLLKNAGFVNIMFCSQDFKAVKANNVNRCYVVAYKR